MESAEMARWFARAVLLLAVVAIGVWGVRRFQGRRVGAGRFGDALALALKRRGRSFALAAGAVAAGAFLIPLAEPGGEVSDFAATALDMLWILLAAWAATILVHVMSELAKWRYDVNVPDNLGARQVHTQVRLLRRVMLVLIWLAAVAGVLLLFDQFRALGGTLLASAGIASLVLGLSAQKTFGAIIAGIHVALSHPINIDDVVVVEGEWGRIEEITLTYVVIRTWDLRRLVLPVAYFLEKPFENWTKTSSDIIGVVTLHVDYALPMEPLRAELARLCREAGSLWDGKTCVLQVTEAGPQTIVVRALVSAPDASKAWDLRCAVREGLIGFIRSNYPDCLPRLRIGMEEPLPNSPGDV